MSALAERILELRRQDMTFPVIAESLNISETTVHNLVKKMRDAGVDVPGKRSSKLQGAWTPERIDRLRALWSDPQYSAEAIARDLGGVSRMGVIGKANRLGLAKRREVTPRPRKVKPSITLPGGVQVAQQSMYNSNVAIWARKPSAAPPECVEASPYSVTLRDVDDSFLITQCRYVEGLPAGMATVFCGLLPKDGSAYCPEHHSRCYRARGEPAE